LFIRLLLLCTSSERYCSFVDVMVYPDAWMVDFSLLFPGSSSMFC
jgi:Mlc titration factor MtfA (ptsG expression regulator)